MSQESGTAKTKETKVSAKTRLANSYYGILGLHPSASVIEIRRSYRELSKLYHPDTTKLGAEIATTKFQQLSEAYGILSNPERRALYDLKIGYSRINVIQAPSYLNQTNSSIFESHSAYLDPTDRPLSAGEIFVLLMLGFTFIACIALVMLIGWIRGEAAWEISTIANYGIYF